MKKIAFIVVYMGKFPDYFLLWLESCKNNESIDFIIFTDDHTEYCYPPNVHVNYITFNELKALVQEHFDFPINLPRVYKLCDFKPAYGEIFNEFLKEYDFWGHCDIDLIWGDIRQFITDELLENNVRIYTRGHCSLYRNTLEVNSMYRTLRADGYKTYEEVFKDENNMLFDEWPGITSIMKLNDVPMFYGRDYADLSYSIAGFKFLNKREHVQKGGYFVYNNGKLYWTDGNQKEEEFLYIHFQKRKLKVDIERYPKEFFLLSPGIVRKTLPNADIKWIVIRSVEYVKFYICMIKRRKNNLVRKLKKFIVSKGTLFFS